MHLRQKWQRTETLGAEVRPQKKGQKRPKKGLLVHISEEEKGEYINTKLFFYRYVANLRRPSWVQKVDESAKESIASQHSISIEYLTPGPNEVVEMHKCGTARQTRLNHPPEGKED